MYLCAASLVSIRYCEKPHVASLDATLPGVEHLCTTAARYTAPVHLYNGRITSDAFQRVRDADMLTLAPLYDGIISRAEPGGSAGAALDDVVCWFTSTSDAYTSVADVMRGRAANSGAVAGTAGWKHCAGVQINGIVGLQHAGRNPPWQPRFCSRTLIGSEHPHQCSLGAAPCYF